MVTYNPNLFNIWSDHFVYLLLVESSLVNLQSNGFSVTREKSPNVDQSCPKMISLEKWNILTPLQKLPKKVGDLDKLIAAKGFEKLPKVQ